MNPRILVRADAGAAAGAGHAARCLALAEESRRGGGAVDWAATELPDWIESRLADAGVSVHRIEGAAGSAEDAAATGALAAERGCEWVVVDGYEFGAEYRRTIAGASARVLAIVDGPEGGDLSADLVLNQNIGARREDYPVGELLLGPGYALLRGEFLKLREWVREIPETARRILVTLGGSDPDNATAKILEALDAEGGDFEVTVLLGGNNVHADEVERLAEAAALRIECVRQAGDMPERMRGADLILTAGGSTVWEASFMGLPGVTGILADNQVDNAERLEAAGVFVNAGWFSEGGAARAAKELARLAGDREARAEMAGRGRELVDGDGAARVLLAMRAGELHLEEAGEADARTLWELVNDPAVRANSFESDPIPWEDHVRWFEGRLADEDCVLWMARDAAGEFVGQVRFEKEGEETEISISLDPAFRGRGCGALLVREGCRAYRERRGAGPVLARIRPENRGSVRAFEKAGFAKEGEELLKGQPALRYRLQPD